MRKNQVKPERGQLARIDDSVDDDSVKEGTSIKFLHGIDD